jgi:alpha-galactosidase
MTDIGEVNEMINLMAEYQRLNTVIQGFRRHPDWALALKTIWKTHPDLFVTLEDGRRAMPEDNARIVFELADQEFIDAIIFRERLTCHSQNANTDQAALDEQVAK